MTKLSVITINYNNAHGLKKTLDSVFSQSFHDFEYIIIDGNSTDRSLDLINEYKSRINYWVSENDDGIYDALNKGIKVANGEYLLFLNSGDSFYSDTVIENFIKFTEKNDYRLIYGNSNILLDNNTERILEAPEQLDFNFWYATTLNHQAVFAKKELFKKYGMFDLNYKICSDFDFLLHVFCNEEKEFKRMNLLVCNYDQSGFSASPENFNKSLAEKHAILKKYLSPAQLKAGKAAYNSSLPYNRRISNSLTNKPLLNAAFKRVYAVYARLKGNGS